MEEEEEDLYNDEPILPVNEVSCETADSKPLIRSMNEFKFWQSMTFASILSLFCSLSKAFDLPVFWPFLLVYFIMLVILTVKRQFRHMSKYKYSFTDFSKKSTVN